MALNNLKSVIGFFAFLALMLGASPSAYAEFDPYPVVQLRSLDKITGRTATFDADVGSTLQYGDIYIRVQACKKRPPIEQPESAAFLQVWEVTPEGKSVWIFSGWMFSSSPALSAMDHPIYDVWVLDCKNDVKEDTSASAAEGVEIIEEASESSEDADLEEESEAESSLGE